MKKVWTIALMLVMVAMMLTSCSSILLPGTWAAEMDDTHVQMNLFKDGTGELVVDHESTPCVWESTDTTLKVVAQESNDLYRELENTTYKIDGYTLIMTTTSGRAVEFKDMSMNRFFPIYISMVALAVWIAFFSAIGMFQTMQDKQKARRRQRRIPEKRLLWFGALGGALVMWLTMILVRHKTRYKKFMIGLPVMALLQIILIVVMWNNRELFYFNWGIG